MYLRDELTGLVRELDRLHSSAMDWDKEVGFPDFVTSENGMQYHFNASANKKLWNVAKILHGNRDNNSLKIEIEQYRKAVRQVVADLYADGVFLDFKVEDDEGLMSKLKALVEERIASISSTFTHYFPAWTLGMEQLAPFTLGPVTFMSRVDWIDSVNFSSSFLDCFLSLPEANHAWKENLKAALLASNDDSAVEGLASFIYTSVANCPALIKVTISGYELEFSRKLARIVSKTALDVISLAFGQRECFLQQTLQDERLPPVRSSTLVETDGFLLLPGWSLGGRVPRWSLQQVRETLDGLDHVLQALASILDGLVDPVSHQCPKLANRWATALDWYGEASREANDAIALAKFGTSLDVLSCGGKHDGICEMVSHLTKIPEDKVVMSEPRQCTLKELVNNIYRNGRSQILHGTHYDRLKSFASDREYAAQLARRVLLEAALKLQNYDGKDYDKAFRSI